MDDNVSLRQNELNTGAPKNEKEAGERERLVKTSLDRTKNIFYKYMPHDIQGTILMTFTIVSFTLLMILGIVLYTLFARRMSTSSIETTELLMKQSAVNLEDYLLSMRRISWNIGKDSVPVSMFAGMTEG